MLLRGKSKEGGIPPRKVTPPSPTYMSSEQFGSYTCAMPRKYSLQELTVAMTIQQRTWPAFVKIGSVVQVRAEHGLSHRQQQDYTGNRISSPLLAASLLWQVPLYGPTPQPAT